MEDFGSLSGREAVYLFLISQPCVKRPEVHLSMEDDGIARRFHEHCSHRGVCRSRHFWVVAVSDVDARKTPSFAHSEVRRMLGVSGMLQPAIL